MGAKLLWCLAKDVGGVLAQLIDVEYVCLENCSSHLGTKTGVVPQNPCVVWSRGDSSSFISSNFPMLSLVSPFCSAGGGFVLFLCSINFSHNYCLPYSQKNYYQAPKTVFKYMKSPILEQ